MSHLAPFLQKPFLAKNGHCFPSLGLPLPPPFLAAPLPPCLFHLLWQDSRIPSLGTCPCQPLFSQVLTSATPCHARTGNLCLSGSCRVSEVPADLVLARIPCSHPDIGFRSFLGFGFGSFLGQALDPTLVSADLSLVKGRPSSGTKGRAP